jgi:methylenetetrahydrofolate reductase (NADPH)
MIQVATRSLDAVGPFPARLFDDFSLETTAGAAGELAAVSGLIAPGTRIAIPYLDGDDLPALISAARTVRDLGFRPVPHLAARRIESADTLAAHLGTLRGVTNEIFLVGGDRAAALGPFADAAAVLRSGLLVEHGVRHVGLPGYPAGHPVIDDRRLWADLAGKAAVLRDQGLTGHVTTQFAEPGQTLAWLDQARSRGIDLPVRIGVPGPAGVPRALSARLGRTEPDAASWAAHLDTLRAGNSDLKFHFSPFGALPETVAWIARAAR